MAGFIPATELPDSASRRYFYLICSSRRTYHTADQAGFSTQQQSVDGLTNNIATTNGSIEDESVIRANADSVLAERTTTLESNYAAQQTDINGVVTNLATANANITEDAQTQTTALQALATRTTNLEADFTAANADISVANASISNEATTRSDADGALASQISTLQATTTTAANNLAASVSNEATARTTADTSLATQITSLQASTNTLSASVSNEITARTTADAGLAQSITTLEADTGSLDNRVTVTESAISGLSTANQAYWTVESVSGDNRAELSVYANANGGAGVDIVGDVTISGSLVVDGTVTTGKLASGAVTQYAQANNASSVNGSGGGTVYTLASFTLTMAYSGDILVWATCGQSYDNTTSAHPWNLSITVDGTRYGVAGGGAATTDSASVSACASVAVGDHVVALMWYGDPAITITTGSASLIAMGAYK